VVGTVEGFDTDATLFDVGVDKDPNHLTKGDVLRVEVVGLDAFKCLILSRSETYGIVT
jgi:hypothetical protein